MEQNFISWAEDVFWEEVEERVLVHSGKPGSRVIRLNPEASAVWRFCDGTMSAEEIVGELLRHYEAEHEVIRRQVGAFIGNFVSQSLLSTLDEPGEVTREELQKDAVIFRDPAVWARQVGPDLVCVNNFGTTLTRI